MLRKVASFLLGAALTALPSSVQAGTITFNEFSGLGDNASIPSAPAGLPDGITATWTGFALHTRQGDTPMSVFPTEDDPGGIITFSGPVVVSSINAIDTSWGGPVTIIAKLQGTEVWRFVSPGDFDWTKLTNGVGKRIDSIQFLGRWNHYDDIVVDLASLVDTDADGLPDEWEYKYFPGDLDKLADVDDFDGDGLQDGLEYTRGTDPTKPDTDGDGLSDLVETGTGTYLDDFDTGTNPTKADTDGDGRTDKAEINGSPTSNPFVADTDGDTFKDGEEVALGHDPNDSTNNPLASAIANSLTQFSGVQGQDNWYWGYRNYTKDGGGESYDATTNFIAFNPATQWVGGKWDLDPTAENPWTELAAGDTHPNSSTNANASGYDTGIQWTIRRWVANSLTNVTPLALRWHVRKVNANCGSGVTSGIYINGQPRDVVSIPGSDSTGITRTFFADIAPGDRVDLILSSRGTDGDWSDGCDGSYTTLLIDPTMPAVPWQPDGSLFITAGAPDTDADGLPDVWEHSYFPEDLTKFTGTGDFDQDGLSDVGEYARRSNPTKADSDGDGLLDLVETGTTIYVSPTDTGSNPNKADTDGDSLSDKFEVIRIPPTNPNRADTDSDTYPDAEEITWRANPTDPNDNPGTFIIANSQAEFSGTQGQNGWYNGYRVFNPIADPLNYNPTDAFVPYPGGEGAGAWNGTSQTWNNGSWDLNTAGAAPWTFQDALGLHPNATNSAPTIGGAPDATKEHWPIRRWVASELTNDTYATIIWKVRKANGADAGTTGLLYINGNLADSKALAGSDQVGETRFVRAKLKVGDIVDLALSPAGKNGNRQDFSDASETSFRVDVRPWNADLDLKAAATQVATNKCTFKFASQDMTQYVIFGSSDLKAWVALQTITATGAETRFTDDLGTAPPAVRFYRVTPK